VFSGLLTRDEGFKKIQLKPWCCWSGAVTQMLVLDEADRILDMGFAGTLNAILGQIPKERQTMLFSATQTRSVKDLARLSLRDPEYLAVHAESAAATPARLQQTVMIVPLEEKMDVLWSFVKTHLHTKMLVFLSSCKQVSDASGVSV
jgi:ATP-dependent RNA helicase DDX10/DBP4